jgi:hypothetical protein
LTRSFCETPADIAMRTGLDAIVLRNSGRHGDATEVDKIVSEKSSAKIALRKYFATLVRLS